MSRWRVPAGVTRWAAQAGVLALVTAACVWVWVGWEPWQIVGRVLGLVVVTVAAVRRLPVPVVIAVVPAAATVAFSVAAVVDAYGSSDGQAALWVLVVPPLFAVMLLGTATVAGLAAAGGERVQRRRRARDAASRT